MLTGDNRTMHALQIVKYGPIKEAFEFSKRVPMPQIKSPHDVLVRIMAAGINPVELKTATGNIKMASFGISFPYILGSDYAGIVEEVGTQVNDFKVGDEVFGTRALTFSTTGTYAQYAVVDTATSAIAIKPKHLSFEQAASAGIAVLAAYQGVICQGMNNEELDTKDRRILVVGASGGVGSYAVQIAKATNQGNTVVGICSGKNTEFVKSLGADMVVNYKNTETFDLFLEEEKEKFDFIFDCVGGDDYYFMLKGLLVKNGRYCTAVGPIQNFGSSNVGPLTLITIASKLLYRKIFTKHKYFVVTLLPYKDFRTKVVPLFENRSILGTVIEKENSVFKLQDGIAAMEKLHSQRTVGKIVLDCT
ncbi:chaperonin 10-like protein [Pilobolus umbonatus]|nr:chaperonin 10-like protein [Pilobolus umbonatus]